MSKSEVSVSGYRIGAVSRITGISPDTLRIWERRYDVVTPQRSAGGGRLYTADDVARLKLIGRLVDKGDAIGVVAGLSQDELLTRLAETSEAGIAVERELPYRIAIIGELLAAKIEAAADALPAIEPVARFDSPQAMLSTADPIEADILLIEQPSLQPDAAIQVVDWIDRMHASHAVIVYRFATKQALERLPRSKCSTLRAPVDAESVQSHCIAIMGRVRNDQSEHGDYWLDPGEMAPPRRYSDQTLARLAAISTTIKCECPRHLAELITSLSAFEKYSGECESRNLKDAELHGYLNSTASQARHMFETALAQVLEAEEIEL